MNRLYGMGAASALAAALMTSQSVENIGRSYDVEVVPKSRIRQRVNGGKPPVEVDNHYKTRAEEKRARKAAKRAAHA